MSEAKKGERRGGGIEMEGSDHAGLRGLVTGNRVFSSKAKRSHSVGW